MFFLAFGFPIGTFLFLYFQSLRNGKLSHCIDSLGVNDEPKMISEALRVSILEFMDADAFNVSVENCESFLDPLIESWDIDLATFGMEIVLNRRLIPDYAKKFAFVERELAQTVEEPGLKEFLRHRSASGDATAEEIEFLKRLPQCINTWRLTASKNSCSLTEGKRQSSAGQEAEITGAKKIKT